jgi:predicted ArsR family transcriptional regulator
MDAMNLEQRQREEARWRILRVLDAGRPIAVSETIVWRVLTDIKLSITSNALRRELSYLRDRGLVEVEGENEETWYARLTASGVDVVEYTAPAPPGIARPRKYW